MPLPPLIVSPRAPRLPTLCDLSDIEESHMSRVIVAPEAAQALRVSTPPTCRGGVGRGPGAGCFDGHDARRGYGGQRIHIIKSECLWKVKVPLDREQ